MPDIPPNITKQNVLEAIKKIDLEGVPVNANSSHYDVVYKSRHYPPKLLVSYANLFANGEPLARQDFAGGKRSSAHRLLEEFGFTIVQKRRAPGAGNPVDPILDIPADRIVQHIVDFIQGRGFQFSYQQIANFYLSLKTKPFVILAGISGTGKTRLAQLFAEAIGYGDPEHCLLLPVRPDWTDPSDLIGYRDLNGNFVKKPLLEIILRARKRPNDPFFVILDEMNLARVEHYLSDLLSAMETRDWEDGIITTVPVLPRTDVEKAEELQQLRLPDNLYLIGTVNMDETTYPFSRKVLDRANTIEFNDVDLQFAPITEADPQLETIILNDFLRSWYLQAADLTSEHIQFLHPTISLLQEINGILKTADLHFAYRLRDEMAFYLLYNRQFGLLSEDQALDLQMHQKILPRIYGSSGRLQRVLPELLQLLNKELTFPGQALPDEFASILSKQESLRFPKSSRKLLFLWTRLLEDGFTTFWI